jgi:hypothetical protein
VSIVKLGQVADGYTGEKGSQRDGESEGLGQRSRPQANGDRNQQQKLRVAGSLDAPEKAGITRIAR